MNTRAIIPDKDDPSLTLIALQIVLVLGAGVFLYSSRFYPIACVPVILLISGAVFLAGYSRYRLFSIFLIGLFTALILALRFEYPPWGDPWFEYGMVQQIIAYHSINPSVYPAQLPVTHVILSIVSFFSGINSLVFLKFIIPSLSVIGLYAVYRFTKDISSSIQTAFFAGLLFLCGTPYLHWITQGVRETMGIALFVLALYISFTAIHTHKKGYLFISLLLIGGLVLTHDLSSILFLLVWIVMSLTTLYLMCDINRIRMTGLFSLLIALTTVIFIVAWGWGRSIYGYSQFNNLMNTIFNSEYWIPLLILSLSFLYLLPWKIQNNILFLRSIVYKIIRRKNLLYTIFLAVTVLGSIVVLNFVLGKSNFVISYPIPMLFNGIFMILLSLIGLYYFLEIERFHILSWVAILTLILVVSMSNIVPFIDPLRFMEFLYIPLAIIAAFGVTRITELVHLSKLLPLVLAVFVIISVVTSFPSVVLLGDSFEPGHPLFDTRSWVIQHQTSEISAISWLNDSQARGVIETDAYVRYVMLGIIHTNALTIGTEYTFVREGGYHQSSDANTQQHYLLILSRFTDYMEFGAQWLKEKKPLDSADLIKIDRDCDIIYDNGNAVIFSFSTQ